VIALSAVLIALALRVDHEPVVEVTLADHLEQAESMLAAGTLDEAKAHLQQEVEPRIATAADEERARFHRAVADWVVAVQTRDRARSPANDQLIIDQYDLSRRLGLALDPQRLENLVMTMIALGRTDEARRELEQFESLVHRQDVGADARPRRNRLHRGLLEELFRSGASFETMMAALDRYRADPLLLPEDEAWAIRRDAEIRQSAGDHQEAIERVLLGMRRLESEEAYIEPGTWGGLYATLARSAYALGRMDHARDYVEEALARMHGHEPAVGDALLIRARMAVMNQDLVGAQDDLDRVIEAFDTLPSSLAARVARAETRSVLGEHEASLEDFEMVVDRLGLDRRQGEVESEAVALSLVDRHDAMLAIGRLDLALRYLAPAERLFESTDVPEDVLLRTASTSRQIGENLLQKALAETSGARGIEDLPPSARAEMSAAFDRAGEYFLRHARAITGNADDSDRWAASLFLSADSRDLAGRPELAAELLQEYVDSRPVSDPRRAEAAYRLGIARMAVRQTEEAIIAFQRVLADHARSPYGTRSIVPLARALRDAGRGREALALLLDVVEDRGSTQGMLTPDAPDYRDAMVELGILHHAEGDHRAAIERLTVAIDRYPDDPRRWDLCFRLGESHRRQADLEQSALESEHAMPPSERLAREEDIAGNREKAMELFATACAGYASVPGERLSRAQREFQRSSWIGRGDVAFALGRYREAADLYERTARIYGEDQISMVALVQVVNCLDRLGDRRQADIAHQNALARLRQLPDAAFSGADAVMDRDAWERWLEHRPLGVAQAEGGQEG